METTTNRRIDHLQDNLVTLKAWYETHGDYAASSISDDLEGKLAAGELTIAICGHFSAGKSSLINTLCGNSVLPSGPVPTTANVALIRNGAQKVVLTKASHDAAEGKSTFEVPPDHLGEYCRDGQTYAKVELWDEIPWLGEHGVLLDTPGVDSGDAAHAMATDSALHLGDVVLYVMDYNHVQSDSNLTFAKQLSAWGKPLYLVVNQIDKHREDELSFEAYRKSVEHTFDTWEIPTAGIFYISLKDLDHPLNRLNQLKLTLQELLLKRQRLLEYSVACSMHHGADSFLRRVEETEEEEAELLLQTACGSESALFQSEDEEYILHHAQEDLKRLEQEWEANNDLIVRLKESFNRSLDDILGSAQLMTPPLREAAEQYLESQQSGFKVGGWFSGGKTEREKERRLAQFMKLLKEQVSAQIDWHVRDLVRKLGKEHGVWDEAGEQLLEESFPQGEASWVTDYVREGAVLSGEYTLRYTEEVAGGIRSRYRRAGLACVEQLLAALAPRVAARGQSLAEQREAAQARARTAERLLALRAASAARAAQLRTLLGAAPSLTPGLLPEVRDPQRPAQSRTAAPAPQAPAAQQPAGAARPQPLREAAAPAAPPAAPQGGRLAGAAAALEAAAAQLAPYPAFGTGVRELRTRAAALRRGRFTAALFGAFSAGKSSFANALLGAKVLPVSPHPTTAAITRIQAPQDGIEHGRAVITFKTVQAMEEDLANSFQALQLGAWNRQSWIGAVRKLKPADAPQSGKGHYSFLKAASAAWDRLSSKLEHTEEVDLHEFAAYAADEQQACFVESIDLYYSCPLTDQGIVLVDTPGADSIHARHTGVTFQYMKHCDALLYVTYYHHAFSRADRQFLAHLGRVKGNFALDKMYFIVNAADLASSPDELNQVVEHVADGLRSSGISAPQLYAVSSIQALAGNKVPQWEEAGIPGFAGFEQAFLHFLHHDLASVAIASADREVAQLISQAEQMRNTLEHSLEERKSQLERLIADKKQYMSSLSGLANQEPSAEIGQEVKELLHYVRQRLRLLAGDLFHEFFHPALLQDDGGDLKRKFTASLQGLLSQMSLELERELQATSLRMERKCTELIQTACEQWTAHMREHIELLPSLSWDGAADWATPEITHGALDQVLVAGEFAAHFKSPKSFFEGGGKQRLRNAMEAPLDERVKEVLDVEQARLIAYYREQSTLRLLNYTEEMKVRWEEWEAGIERLAADDPMDGGQWDGLIGQLSNLRKSLRNIV